MILAIVLSTVVFFCIYGLVAACFSDDWPDNYMVWPLIIIFIIRKHYYNLLKKVKNEKL